MKTKVLTFGNLQKNVSFLKNFLFKHGLIFGRTQSGKTTFVFNTLKHIPLPKNHFILFFNTQFDKRFNIFKTVTKVPEIPNAFLKSKIVNYFPKSFVDPEDELSEIIKLSFRLSKYVNLTFILDEVQAFSTKFKIPFWLKMIVTRGLGHGINFIGITQRLQNINHNFMTQSFWFILFPLNRFDYPYLNYYGIPIPNWKIHKKGYSKNCFFYNWFELWEIML